MDGLVELSPNALSTLDRAVHYIGRDKGAEQDAEEWAAILLNASSGRIQRYCGRELACRTHRTSSTISCTSTVDDQTLTGAGFLALKAVDDAMGVNLAFGSRIQSITSDAALELTRKAKVTGSASVTFGSAPLTLSGSGTDTLRIPQSPLVEVYSAKWLDPAGLKTAIDLTAHRIVRETTPGESQLILMSGDTFPWGRQNIELELKVGLRAPSATDLGDLDDWNDLELACLRLIEIGWQDFKSHAGRSGDLSLVQAAQHITSFKLPDDISQALAPVRRVG